MSIFISVIGFILLLMFCVGLIASMWAYVHRKIKYRTFLLFMLLLLAIGALAGFLEFPK